MPSEMNPDPAILLADAARRIPGVRSVIVFVNYDTETGNANSMAGAGEQTKLTGEICDSIGKILQDDIERDGGRMVTHLQDVGGRMADMLDVKAKA